MTMGNFQAWRIKDCISLCHQLSQACMQKPGKNVTAQVMELHIWNNHMVQSTMITYNFNELELKVKEYCMIAIGCYTCKIH